MNNRRFQFWQQKAARMVDTNKMAQNVTEIGKLASTGWKNEIANSPKVFWYAICFGAGYHFYDAWIRPTISGPMYEEPSGATRRPIPRAPGK